MHLPKNSDDSHTNKQLCGKTGPSKPQKRQWWPNINYQWAIRLINLTWALLFTHIQTLARKSEGMTTSNESEHLPWNTLNMQCAFMKACDMKINLQTAWKTKKEERRRSEPDTWSVDEGWSEMFRTSHSNRLFDWASSKNTKEIRNIKWKRWTDQCHDATKQLLQKTASKSAAIRQFQLSGEEDLIIQTKQQWVLKRSSKSKNEETRLQS